MKQSARYLRATTLIDESLEEVLYECLRNFILLLATAANQEQTSIVYHLSIKSRLWAIFFNVSILYLLNLLSLGGYALQFDYISSFFNNNKKIFGLRWILGISNAANYVNNYVYVRLNFKNWYKHVCIFL